ncbi:MAG TPA: 3-dehydroquinate synthase [Armatimonadetes bacterium]|nr:3-dehydroquinate synthase [Armatimonadota bacterium]
MPTTVEINTGTAHYPIYIGTDLLPQVGERLRAVVKGQRVLVVTHPRLAELYGGTVQESLRAVGCTPTLVAVPPGERRKSLKWVRALYEVALTAGLDRQDSFLALGGGVIGDLTGFAAATYLRGVAYVQVPTTLLAQVDSSVGGKVGVNLPQGKNLVGAFYHPRLVVADVSTLRTLPLRERRAGLAEVIKYGLILDADLFAFLETQLLNGTARGLAFTRRRALGWETVTYLVRRSCELKGQVVAADEREAGWRAILNYGHTVGHALEAVVGYGRLRHGEAVAIGMVCASQLGKRMGLLQADDVARIERLLRAAGLPTSPPPVDVEAVLATMQHDKKRAGGKLRFVLLQRIGEALITDEVPLAWVREVLLRCK